MMEGMRVLARAPDTLHLRLQPTTVTFSQETMTQLVLSLGADEETIVQQGLSLLAEADWTKDGIEIRREMELGARIQDTFAVDGDGRLLLTREVEFPMRKVKAVLVYSKGPQVP